jgi:peptide/nickel transport system permease protein
MQQYIIRRILLNFLVLFFVATMVFSALRIDSSQVVSNRAAACFAGDINTAGVDCIATTKAELGLDKPVLPLSLQNDIDLPIAHVGVPKLHGDSQYWNFMSGLVQGDLGESWKTKEPVLGEIRERALPSIELGLLQILLAVVIAMPVGIISAIRQDSFVDFKIMFGPALIGGLGTGAVIMRFLRSQMLEVLRQDYVRTAWSKGLKERVIIIRHALKNALIPVLTLIGILLGTVVSGNVVLENIYTIPGIGNYVVFAVAQQLDFPVIQGIVLVVALALVFINLLVDIAYGWLDPRIRYS